MLARRKPNKTVSQHPDGLGRTALVKLRRELAATPHASATDAKPPVNRLKRPKTGRAERQFAAMLRKVADHAGHLVKAFQAGDIELLPRLTQLLHAYADSIEPWAETVVRRMLGEVDARDRDSWRAL